MYAHYPKLSLTCRWSITWGANKVKRGVCRGGRGAGGQGGCMWGGGGGYKLVQRVGRGGGEGHTMLHERIHLEAGRQQLGCSASKGRGQEEAYREGGQGKDHDQHAGQLAQAHTHPALSTQAVQHLALPPLCIVVALLLHAHTMPAEGMLMQREAACAGVK